MGAWGLQLKEWVLILTLLEVKKQNGEGVSVVAVIHLRQLAAVPHVLPEFGFKLRPCTIFMVRLMLKRVARLCLLLEGSTKKNMKSTV